MNFGSDNQYGVDARIMQAMVDANKRLTDASYCHDDDSKRVEERLSKVFEKDVKAFLVLNGTGANALALSAACPPHGGIFCHESSHINTDECNAPEMVTGGAKLVTLQGDGNIITPETLKAKLAHFVHGEHGAKPCVLSISQVTELGRVYSTAQVLELSKTIKPLGMKLHMDGARFANALVTLNCSPAEMTWKAGVDILSFGGTKNGGMAIEAVVFFDTNLAEDFLHRRKRGMQHLSKGRYLSAQMLAYLQDDVWLPNARHANAMATMLAEGLRKSNTIRVSQPAQANEVFAYMPKAMHAEFESNGAHFYEWPADGCGPDETHVRFVLSFATPKEHVDKFLSMIR